MKYIRIVLWSWIAIGVGIFAVNMYMGRYSNSSGKSTNSEELMLVAPKYDNWLHCSGDITRVCFDDNPLVSNQGVIEYLGENQEKKILVWWVNERSNKVFTTYGDIVSFWVDTVRYSFFVWKDDYWKLVGQNNFRRNKSPKNENIPVFALDLDSLLAREYVALMLQRGKKINEIKPPTTSFLK